MDKLTTVTEPGKKIRIWQGWYRHDKVYRVDNGEKKYCGFIQVKRQSGSDSVTSHIEGSAVMGADPIWIAKNC